MILRGCIHKYGADVNTDVIIPARYLNVSDPAELGRHCMEDLDAEFLQRVQPGDIVLASTNFGCGSSREHAPIALRAAGISCVIAESFARIFYRNAINIGLPIVELSARGGADIAAAGEEVEVDLTTGAIRNLTTGTKYQAQPFPPFMLELLAEGGLVEHTKKRLAAKGH